MNLHVFHLLQTLSRHTAGIDAGVPARGLHGEAYRGHVFWDELFVIPFVNLRLPRLTRALASLPLPAAARGALGVAGGGLRGSHVPVAERKRWP